MELGTNYSQLFGESLMASPASNLTTDLVPGLAGLSSIAGGFDHAVLTHATPPENSGLVFSSDEDFMANFSSTLSSFASSTPKATMDPFMMFTHDKVQCGHFTVVERKVHFTVDVAGECRFWTEGVLSSVVAAFGLLGNLVSIWVLSVAEMRNNAFNRLLLALAIIDCLFILPGIAIYTAKAFDWRNELYNYAFPVFLYPFSEIALCSSIYMTVAIAVERYIGLCRPMQRLSGRGPCSAKVYILPVLVIALLLNVPKFFESETVLVRVDPVTNMTQSKVKVTELRTDPRYITYYWMWTRLLATGIIPLAVLALLNTKIYLSIRHSKQQLRILAIRSALPMAILGQNAPSVPISDLLKGGSNSPRQQNGCSNNNNADRIQSCKSPVRSSPPPPSSPLCCLASNNNAMHEAKPNTPSSPQNGKSPRIVNGHLRQIQRSVSAFEPAIKRTFRMNSTTQNRSASSASMLRSNSRNRAQTTWSVAAAAAAAGVAGAQPGGGPPGPVGADMKLAPILFGVVIVFVLCNSLRVILNVYDFSVVESIIVCEKKGVGRLPPSWVLCSISISHLLLMVNSSVNFLVYCVAGTRFRRILFRKIRVCLKRLMDMMCCRRPKEVNLIEDAAAAAGKSVHQENGRRRHTILTASPSALGAAPQFAAGAIPPMAHLNEEDEEAENARPYFQLGPKDEGNDEILSREKLLPKSSAFQEG